MIGSSPIADSPIGDAGGFVVYPPVSVISTGGASQIPANAPTIYEAIYWDDGTIMLWDDDTPIFWG